MPVTRNPLQQYREAQRTVREQFEPFTSTHCPTCATPCCRKPTRMQPFDVVLVQELGYRLPVRDAGHSAGILLDLLVDGEPVDAGEPCDFLQQQGCSFPADLRPYGCAASICDPMRQLLPPEELAQVELAVAKLTEAHERLTAVLLAQGHPNGVPQ